MLALSQVTDKDPAAQNHDFPKGMNLERGRAADSVHLPQILEFILEVKSNKLLFQVGKLRPREVREVKQLLAPQTLTCTQGHEAQWFSLQILYHTLHPSSKKRDDLKQNPSPPWTVVFSSVNHSAGHGRYLNIHWVGGRLGEHHMRNVYLEMQGGYMLKGWQNLLPGPGQADPPTFPV